jgi:hypothetical protein
MPESIDDCKDATRVPIEIQTYVEVREVRSGLEHTNNVWLTCDPLPECVALQARQLHDDRRDCLCCLYWSPVDPTRQKRRILNDHAPHQWPNRTALYVVAIEEALFESAQLVSGRNPDMFVEDRFSKSLYESMTSSELYLCPRR